MSRVPARTFAHPNGRTLEGPQVQVYDALHLGVLCVRSNWFYRQDPACQNVGEGVRRSLLRERRDVFHSGTFPEVHMHECTATDSAGLRLDVSHSPYPLDHALTHRKDVGEDVEMAIQRLVSQYSLLLSYTPELGPSATSGKLRPRTRQHGYRLHR